VEDPLDYSPDHVASQDRRARGKLFTAFPPSPTPSAKASAVQAASERWQDDGFTKGRMRWVPSVRVRSPRFAVC
jgi:hypothetical protein